MTQKRFIRAAAVLVLALSVSPLAAMSPLNASAPTAKPGEIVDLPSCDGKPIDPQTKRQDTWPERKMVEVIGWRGVGRTPEESVWTEKLGNVVVRIYTSRAPKETTRFQLRYWTGTWGVDEAGPFHAKFFKKSPLRVQIPNAQYDTPYKFQVAALKGDCIAFATSAYQWMDGAWCSVKLKLRYVEWLGTAVLSCPKIKG